MKQLKFILFFLLITALQACKEEKIGPAGSGNTPQKISDVSIKNVNGAAVIHYKIPDAENTSYVVAEYETKAGVVRTTKSSKFKDSLKVEGFSESGDYKVSLFAVGAGEQRSEVTQVTVSPKEPAYSSVLRSIQLQPTFGGITIRYTNPDEAELKIGLLEDQNKNVQLLETFSTKLKEGIVAKRGFESKERKFGVFIRDRFNNYSDTVYTSVTPFFEQELDKAKFKELTLAGDFNEPNNSSKSRLNNLWDGITANGANTDFFATVNGYGFPQTFSFDLGVKCDLSRFKYYARSESGNIYKNSPRYFEIWGSNVADGDWKNWTKLRDCEMIKISGAPDGEYTAADVAYIEAGIDYDFPPGTPAFRYIRFKTLEVWSGGNIAIYELTFWGKPSSN